MTGVSHREETIGGLLREGRAALADTAEVPGLEAEILLGHVLEQGRAYLRAWPERRPASDAVSRFRRLVARRARGEPMAYLTGTQEFWSLPLVVDPRALVPRPETELLVEQALERIPMDTNWQVLDLGTGSGAVALAIARERPAVRVTATDRSPGAMALARHNASELGIHNVYLRRGSWFQGIGAARFHLIVSNPPYVRENDPLLAGDLRWEPRAALAGGADGLDAIRRIATDAPAHLRPGGWLLLEHGFDQGRDVCAILGQQGYTDVRCYRDAAGHERVTECCLPPASGAQSG